MIYIFDIKEVGGDELFNMMRAVRMEFTEVAFIDRIEGFEADFHIHDWYDISFVMKGSLHYEIEGEKYKVSEGEVAIVPPGKRHKEYSEEDGGFEVLFICISFTKDGSSFNMSEYLGLSHVMRLRDLKEIYELFEEILREVTYREEGFLFKINALVCNLLVLLFRSRNEIIGKLDSIRKLSDLRKKKITQEIMNFMAGNFPQKISLQELSKKFFLSPQYLSSVFKAYSGSTPIEYLNRIRISRAKELFLSGEKNISAVAQMVGISDIHYFYKVFKQFEKITPAQFIASSK